MKLNELFRETKPVIGMLHLLGNGREETFAQAMTEIEQMYANGVDAILVENYFGDVYDVERALAYLQEKYGDHVYGVNILDDFAGSYRMAKRYGAAFMQVDSVCGHLRPADDARYAREIQETRDGSVFVLGGVRFKYKQVRSGRSLEEDLRLGMERCDAIVVTGAGTGMTTDIGKIRAFREIIGDFPLIVGAGMTVETCGEQLSVADGAIVGSWFKRHGAAEYPIDPQRVRAMMDTVKALRKKG